MKTSVKQIETMGFKVYSDDLAHIKINNEGCRVINTISPNSYGISTKDYVFNQALKSSDYLVLDGVYFALASIILKGKNIRRNQGPDVFDHFIRRLNASHGKAFFIGSTEKTLSKIKANANRDFPNLEVKTYSPPFKATFSETDNQAMINQVNAFEPDILFVGMTCPKQEKWAIRHRNKLKAGLVICIGNVFDWYAGTQKAVHPLWYKLRLGWLIRIFLRPEIFRRNIGNQMTFFWHLLLNFSRMKKI